MQWHRYDRERKAETTPAAEELVWVWEIQDDPSPGLGYFDGHCWRMWWGADDCHVTHWADLSYPDLDHPDDLTEDERERDSDPE